MIGKIRKGNNWSTLFPGTASLHLNTNGQGLNVSLRFTRQVGAAPVKLVRVGEAGAKNTTLVREIDLLDRYSLGCKDLSIKLGITVPATVAIVHHLNLRSDPECFHEFRIGKTVHKRYSLESLQRIQGMLPKLNLDKIWHEYRDHIKTKPKTKKS